MNDKPLVSVLMTSYNREKYIAEAIESVLASTYKNWELIIVDDGSKDRTVEIAKKYEAKDIRIKVYINEINLGDYPNRNKAASYAKGKYLKYLDSDDIIYSHGLEVMVNAMEQFPEAGFGTYLKEHDDSFPLPKLFTPKEAYLTHFSEKGIFYIGPSGTIINREYFFKIGQFQNYGVASDYEFNLRAGIEKPIVLFHRDLFWWRVHGGQEIINSNKNNNYLIYNYLINKKNIKISPLNSETRKILLLNNEILMGRKLLKKILSFKFKTFSSVVKSTNYPIFYLIRSVYFTKKLTGT